MPIKSDVSLILHITNMTRQLKILAILLLYLRRKRRHPQRAVWVHKILLARRQCGEFHKLVLELRLDEVCFQGYFRLSRAQFDDLLSRVGPSIARADTNYRRPICPAERLAICLRYLATGHSFKTIAYSYRVGHSTAAHIVYQVTRAIWTCLVDECMPVPTKEEWRAITADFYQRWNFPN